VTARAFLLMKDLRAQGTNYLRQEKFFVIIDRTCPHAAPRALTGTERAHGKRPEKILEERHVIRVLFFRQEKSFQDLLGRRGARGLPAGTRGTAGARGLMVGRAGTDGGLRGDCRRRAGTGGGLRGDWRWAGGDWRRGGRGLAAGGWGLIEGL
jgi:hypothetical protein